MSKYMQSPKKTKENMYEDRIDTVVSNAQKLVKKKIISERFASILVEFFIKKQIKDDVQHYMSHILRNKARERLLMINYERRRTSYF